MKSKSLLKYFSGKSKYSYNTSLKRKLVTRNKILNPPGTVDSQVMGVKSFLVGICDFSHYRELISPGMSTPVGCS
jgi:hypothetical protein